MTYPFLVLDLLLLGPALIVFFLRPDLQKMMWRVGMCALPFALTEFLFYPTYWSPRFLFDLADKIGFGIEDMLFVFLLGAMAAAAYPFCFRKKLIQLPPVGGSPWRRAVAMMGGALIMAAGCAVIGIPLIWGAPVIMMILMVGILSVRRDLVVPGLWGAAIVGVTYFVICVVLEAIRPGIFASVWHVDRFSDTYVLNVPLEEIGYALAAGGVGTVFYPFVFSMKLVPLDCDGNGRLDTGADNGN